MGPKLSQTVCVNRNMPLKCSGGSIVPWRCFSTEGPEHSKKPRGKPGEGGKTLLSWEKFIL